jgi:hypothetical protein
VGAQAIGLLIGAVGGTAFVVFNSSRIPPPFGVGAAVLAVLALVGLIVLLVRRRGADEEASGSDEGSGMFSRGYRLVVVAEVVAIVLGVVVLGRIGLSLAVLPWVAFVVGVHFVALGRVWRRASLGWVGAVVAICGVVGFALALGGGPDPAIALAGGIAPGVALLAGSWWAATRLMSAEIH